VECFREIRRTESEEVDRGGAFIAGFVNGSEFVLGVFVDYLFAFMEYQLTPEGGDSR
jgi:hypothetical protein